VVTALKTTFRVLGLEVRVMNIITTFSNISGISWLSALWVYNVVSSTPRQEQDLISQRKWRYVLIAQIHLNQTTIQSQPRLESCFNITCLKFNTCQRQVINFLAGFIGV
jgi:hypothetical protein